MEDHESFEEEVVTREVPGAATGLRLIISLVLMALGLVLVALGAFVVSSAAVRVPLVLGGIGLLVGFGYVAVGARRIGGGGSSRMPGADLPQSEVVRTTTLRTEGLPKHGEMPPKRGKMPSRGDEGETQRESDKGRSGGGG
jgi:hypothetical protein